MDKEANEGDFHSQLGRTPEQTSTSQRQDKDGAEPTDVYTHISETGDIFTPDSSAALPARKRTPAEIPPEEFELLHASYELLHAKNQHRNEQARQRMARKRQENPGESREKHRLYMREYRLRKRQEDDKQQAQDSKSNQS